MNYKEFGLRLENNKKGFIYSFDMSEEIEHFKFMPEDIQISAECIAVKIIYESFVVPGDEDYLMSRLLAQNGLQRGFFWAAAQTIEKYLKAYLLMNGVSVINFTGHPIKKLFIASSKIDPSLINLDIMPHPNIHIEYSYSSLLQKYTIQQFLAELEEHGNADNRYNAIGVKYNTGHLCALDSFSFKLRKMIGVIPIEESFKKLSPDLIQIFKKNNSWFCKERDSKSAIIPSENFPLHSSSSVTSLEFLIKHDSNPAYRLAYQWLKLKMKLPKKKINYL